MLVIPALTCPEFMGWTGRSRGLRVCPLRAKGLLLQALEARGLRLNMLKSEYSGLYPPVVTLGSSWTPECPSAMGSAYVIIVATFNPRERPLPLKGWWLPGTLPVAGTPFPSSASLSPPSVLLSPDSTTSVCCCSGPILSLELFRAPLRLPVLH